MNVSPLQDNAQFGLARRNSDNIEDCVSEERQMPQRSVPGISDIAVFVAVAENGSFTRAAEKLGTSKSNAGKAVNRLETHLGTRLFQRTTRTVRLTEDGQTYFQHARTALEELAGAEEALAARRSEPAGRVRMDFPAGLGRLLLPTLALVRTQYPKVTFEVSLADRQSDPVGEGWDLVVRIGELPDGGNMTVRRLCVLREGLYASPGYLQRRGQVRAPHELQGHDGAVFRGSSGSLRPWRLFHDGRIIEVVPPSTIIFSDGQGLVDAIVAGVGIANLFDRVAAPYVASGKLSHVLPECDVAGPPVHALVPLGRRMPRKTRVVLDHLAKVLAQPPAT